MSAAIVAVARADEQIKGGGTDLSEVKIAGFSWTWPQVNGGDILAGRNFTQMEYAAGARVMSVSVSAGVRVDPCHPPATLTFARSPTRKVTPTDAFCTADAP